MTSLKTGRTHKYTVSSPCLLLTSFTHSHMLQFITYFTRAPKGGFASLNAEKQVSESVHYKTFYSKSFLQERNYDRGRSCFKIGDERTKEAGQKGGQSSDQPDEYGDPIASQSRLSRLTITTRKLLAFLVVKDIQILDEALRWQLLQSQQFLLKIKVCVPKGFLVHVDRDLQ